MIDTKLDGKTKDIVSENISKMKELFPTVFKEDVVDYDELFENFDLQEFQRVFNKNHIKYYNTMAVCFIFFMSNYIVFFKF